MSHLPVRTVTIQILSNKRTQLEKIFTHIKNLYVVSFLSLRTSFTLRNVLVCRLRLEEFTKRIAVPLTQFLFLAVHLLRQYVILLSRTLSYKWNKFITDGLGKSAGYLQLQTHSW